MESTPSTSKRVKTKAVRSGGRLEGLFSGDNDLIERYRYETSIKKINNPKVVCFDCDLAGDSIVEGLATSISVFRDNVPNTSQEAPSELAKHNKRRL